MSVFDDAYKFTMGAEGGYSNDPDDRGGETIFGIARKFNPDWEGWEVVDSIKHRPSFAKMLMQDVELIELAHKFYKANYWDTADCDEYAKEVAAVVFDCAVNHGVGRAKKMLQEAAGVTADGIIGPVTKSQIKLYNGKTLAGNMLSVRARFFKQIVEKNPSQQKFLNGWLNRISALKSALNI